VESENYEAQDYLIFSVPQTINAYSVHINSSPLF